MPEWGRTDLPSGWVVAAIEQFARTATGGTPSRAVPAYFGGGIPWVKSGELGDGLVQSTEETLSELGVKSSNAKVFPRGTVCLALYGATVGKIGILDIDAATNQAVCGIFLPKNVDTRYMFNFLLSRRRELIEQGKGGAQSNISNGIVRQLPVPLAPRAEQVRIVAKIEELFSDLDAGVAALERVRANLKRYRAAVLKAAVEGRLTEEWRARNPATEPASELLERILAERRAKWEQDQLRKFKEAGKTPSKGWKDKYAPPVEPDTSARAPAPPQWQVASFDSLAENFDGQRVPVKASDRATTAGDIPYYGASGIIDHVKDYLFDGHYLLIAEDGANLVSRHTPIAFEAVGRFWVNNHAHIVQPLAGIPIAFVRHYLNAISLQFWVTGTAQPKLTQAALQKIPVPLPPLAEQAEIVAEVDRRLSVADAAEKEMEHALRRAGRLRQAILKRAFEGRLVPQDPTDEPAAALLERISSSSTPAKVNVGGPAGSKKRRAVRA